MRSSASARTAAALAVGVLITAGVAGAAEAAKGGNGGGGKGGGKPPKGTTTTTTTGTSAIQAAHTDVCPRVSEYTSCSALSVTIKDFGNVGWAGYAHPANHAIDYNSYFNASQAAWSNVVAHEVGGHLDAWNEIVARVGTTQAWTDYYDIDAFAVPWATARWSATKGSTRSFSTGEAKEAYLDCAGPVTHGYQGNYLYMWGLGTTSQQQTFCKGHANVLEDALTKSR